MIDDTDYYKFLKTELSKLGKKKIPFWRYTSSPRNDTLKYSLTHIKNTQNGLIAEFGVWKGGTINIIAQDLKNNTIYGFDSFTGFPNDGRKDWDQELSLKGKLPNVRENVKLVKGYYKDTLPEFVSLHAEEYFSFIHIDCDIYSSTKTIFEICQKLIQPGCIIVFDELLHYKGFLDNEMLAFYQFIKETNYKFEWIGIRGKVMDIDTLMKNYQLLPKKMSQWREKGYYQEVAVKII